MVGQMMINESELESGFEEEDFEFDDQENGMKKRKRKSTAQLKVLKKEFEQESNWDKEKITEMAEATGLSQAQVYKWWWDQKKKNLKYEKEALRRLADKKKMIKKANIHNIKDKHSEEESSDDENDEKIETRQKVKFEIVIALETEKKINKRLTFA